MGFVQQKKGRWSILPCGFRRTRFLWGGITCSKVTTNFLLFSENSLRSGLSLQAKILLTIKEKNHGKKHEQNMKNPKKLHVSFQSMFFLCGLHNLGKIRPNHWTLRESDMPRMLCPARCRKVWIRCLNTFENNKCRWYLWLMTLGWNRSTHSMRYHQVYYVCVRLCPSRLLHIDMLYNLIVGTPFGNWMFLPSKQTAADQQTTKDSSELFFGQYIYIYMSVCVFSWWFHWFHIFSWCCSMFFIICSHDFPIVFPYLPRYFVSCFFHIFFRKKICSNRFFRKETVSPYFSQVFPWFPEVSWNLAPALAAPTPCNGPATRTAARPAATAARPALPVRWPRSYGVPWGGYWGLPGSAEC